MAQPTTKQRLAFKELLTAIDNGTPFNLKDIMINAGYSEASAKNPTLNLISKQGWKQLLAQIDDSVILAKFYEILLSEDKRSSMEAGKELLKLKDRYPAGKLKINQYEDELKDLAGSK
jgi:phage terminase small subunit